jgi:carbonic anhydrase
VAEATLADRAVTDPAVTVRADVELLRQSPLRPGRARVSGHVYDVATGHVQTIVPDSAED